MTPIRPGARDKASVLAMIANASGVIVGQHAGYNLWSISSSDSQFNYAYNVTNIYNTTGKWPAMLGISYGTENYTAAEIKQLNAYAIAYWQAGGLVEIDHMPRNPWTGGDQWDLNRGRLIELVTPGNAAYNAWNTELDKVHAGFIELRDAGVVVLWRPMSEMTYIDSEWYNLKSSEWNANPAQATADFVAVWRDMYQRFADCSNLIWVYGAANNQWSVDADALWPGDDVVDIAGMSLYESKPALDTTALGLLARHGKPLAFTEFGGPSLDGNQDLMVRLAMLKTYPQIKYVLFWHSWASDGMMDISHEKNASAFMNDSWIITRDELK